MSDLRYFINPYLNLDDTKTDLNITDEYLKNKIKLLCDEIRFQVKCVTKAGCDGLYLGTGGISYMFYYLTKNPAFNDCQEEYLNSALDFISPAIKCARVNYTDKVSFILGNSGIYSLAAVLNHKLNDISKTEYFQYLFYDLEDICLNPRFLSCGSDELFVGRAGYILGALWMAKEIGKTPCLKKLYEICNIMVQSGREYATRRNSRCPLMYAYYNVEYLGAAHGLSTILQALITVPGYLDFNKSAANDIKTSIDYLLSLQDDEGNFPSVTNEIGLRKNVLVHWCHGAPGIIYLMAKAYLVWKNEKYLKSCEKMCKLIWEKGLLKKGPGICHGIACNGYAFLLLYRLTQDSSYLFKAKAFAKFLDDNNFKQFSRKPDNPYSLYEGIAGTVCFLADILNPDKAVFPFCDVFNIN